MITKDEAKQAYNNLVQLRRLNVLQKNKSKPGEVELHHIIPISCGGKDVVENKVALYAKEHFMAHVYLWIIHHDDTFHDQTLCALNQMIKGTLNGLRKDLREFIIKSEEYQKARIEFARYMSKTISSKILGEKNPAYGKHWYKDQNNLSCGMFYEGKQPVNWIPGRIQPKTEKVLKQMKSFSQSIKGKKSIYNPITLKRKYISENEQLPNGFIIGVPKKTEEEKEKIRKSVLLRTTNNSEYCMKRYMFYYPLYLRYSQVGFKQMKQEYLYPYSVQNFIAMCKKYIPNFIQNKTRY